MSDRHDYLALDWVRGEIQETLNQAQQALESFVDNPDDATRMRFCQTHLHQVYGTLQMVEFYGAALLAEEMEKLAQALLDGNVGNVTDSQETLMRAILQLPPYLDRVASNRRDLPVVLLPLLNDLRAARGESLLSETSLFKPDLSEATGQGQIPDDLLNDPRFILLAKKIRQMFQIALLGVLRNDNMGENLGYMAKVFTKLEQVTGDAPRAPLWSISNALVEGLSEDAIILGTSVKLMLGHVDRNLRELAVEGAASLNRPAPTELIKNLLYYVAKADVDSPRIRDVKARFRLDEALPSDDLVNEERQRMTGPDAQAMNSVVQALSEELTTVKDALESFVHSGDTDTSKLQPLTLTLKQVADTVAVLGLGQPRTLVEEQLHAMEDIVAGKAPAERESLMDIAGALLYVEATLAGISGDRRSASYNGQGDDMPSHVGQAMDAVLRECRAGLEEAKDGIVEFIASQWNTDPLQVVPERLNAVRGGLDVIQLGKPALILRQCVQFIEEKLLQADQPKPDWRSMDTLADAITSVEYYLERLSDDPATTDDILQLARASVEALGYPLEEEQDFADNDIDVERIELEQTGLDTPAESHDSADSAVAEHDVDAWSGFSANEQLDDETDTTAQDQDPTLELQPLESDDEGPDFDSSDDDELLDPTLEITAPAEPETHVPEASDADTHNDDDDDLIDDEIIEIFQEEVGEVLDALDEYFPRWAANTSDEESLVEFRRAFHTLKGSGRMVGASTVGELGWSVENMLNRVIDRTIVPTAVLIALVQEVRNRVPALVNAFTLRQPDPFDVQPLADAADTLAAGGQIDQVPVIVADDSTTDAIDDTATDTIADVSPDAPDTLVLEADAHSEPDSTLELTELPSAENADATSSEHTLSAEDLAAFDAAASEDTLTPWDTDDSSDDIHVLPVDNDLTEIDESLTLDLPEQEPDYDAQAPAHSSAAAAESLSDIPDMSDGAPGDDAPGDGDNSDEGPDTVLLEIFSSEARRNLALIAQWLAGNDTDLSEHPVDDSVHRALHTLKGSARMAEIEAVAEVAEPAEKLARDLISSNRRANQQQVDLLAQSHDLILTSLDQLDPTPPAHLPGADALIQSLNQQRDQLQGSDSPGPDPHILSVFLSEGMDLIVDAEQLLSQWAQHPEHTDELVRLRDELELLSNSATTAGLNEIHDLAAALAGCYSAVEGGRLAYSERLFALAGEGQDALMNMMDCLAAGQTVRPELGLVDALRELAEGDGPDGGPDGGLPTDSSDTPQSNAAPVSELSAETPDSSRYEAHLDPELVELFLEEAEEILESASHILDQWEAGDSSNVSSLQRDLHTLKGGARMAGVAPVGDLAHELENLYEGYNAGQLESDAALFQLLHQCHDSLAVMIENLQANIAPADAPALVAAIQAFIRGEAPGAVTPSAPDDDSTPPFSNTGESESADSPVMPAANATDAPAPVAVEDAPEPTEAPPQPERDPELVEIFLEEADEILESAGNSLELWISQQDNLIELQSLQRDLHTLKGGARMAEVPELGDLGHELETLYEGLAQSQLAIEPTLFDLLHRCHDQLAEMVEALKANRPLPSGEVLITAIHGYAADPAGFTLPAMAASPPPATAASEAPTPASTAADDAWQADSDPEILEIFLEESEELSDIIDACLTSWKDHPESTDFIDDLKRALHTLKGGARLAGLKQLGDISHDFETYLLELESRRQTPAQSDFQPMLDWHDQINRGMESVAAAAQTSAPAPETPDAAAPANTLPAATDKQPAPQQPQKDDRRQRQNQAQPQEMVRVGADVLEALVNLAGETSINRGRVEQGITEFAFNVEEMGNTVQRLYEQLRRLDSETEAQIMSNYQKGVDLGEYDEDFDPLEMDQYSELHQITKQLSESASDLLDLKNTLLDRNKDTETLLLQQARINTELQEKLMRTRMVPFSRLVPRLRRIVRQISGEVDKRVDFDVLNPEGELDRSLMERVVAPLEHMLRNAVDHGIETSEGRQSAGKDGTGRINLELGREGGEVVITLSDDGKGIDTDAVRKKAIERGLIAADAQLSEQEIQQFIFHAGFSTAAAVTQISGRGVGMDVVASEIKQMGGSVTIDSRKGQGTRFIIRLPFTLAMNRALMVKAAEDSYAIPLNQIEGIVRISPFELQHYFEEENPVYTYVGQDYELQYLGHFVHGNRVPHLENQTTPMPVLLIRSTEHTVAIVVDDLVGSREVVVKAVGPQLATVAGISGATILGDGSVVIILDIHSLIRAAHVQTTALAAGETVPTLPQEPEEELQPQRDTPLVMVTDDSVTVRKVTTRLLERNGYEVVTAKDGIDAIAKLEDIRPDVMLLDIEMPRMDGFEVATHVRHDSRLQDVPIIMITSRTGEKHRERAFDIGVNCYMGKPFQENELLSTIRELLGELQETDNG